VEFCFHSEAGPQQIEAIARHVGPPVRRDRDSDTQFGSRWTFSLNCLVRVAMETDFDGNQQGRGEHKDQGDCEATMERANRTRDSFGRLLLRPQRRQRRQQRSSLRD
jgi:hypothetical protein